MEEGTARRAGRRPGMPSATTSVPPRKRVARRRTTLLSLIHRETPQLATSLHAARSPGAELVLELGGRIRAEPLPLLARAHGSTGRRRGYGTFLTYGGGAWGGV